MKLMLYCNFMDFYDLDSNPAVIRSWTELPEVRAARDFFRVHEKDFKQD